MGPRRVRPDLAASGPAAAAAAGQQQQQQQASQGPSALAEHEQGQPQDEAAIAPGGSMFGAAPAPASAVNQQVNSGRVVQVRGGGVQGIQVRWVVRGMPGSPGYAGGSR